MLINSIDILEKFNAIMTGRDIQACNIVTYEEWLEDSFDPHINKQKEGYSAITVKLLIEGNSEEDNLYKISQIVALCKKGELKFSDLEFTYNISLEKHQEKLVSKILYELTLNFKSTFKLGEELTVEMNRETFKSIDVKGNEKTPCIIEILPLWDTIDISISGLNDKLIIKNLKANKKIIIDSIKGTVLEEGKNKFGDTDFWEFPFLVSGTNNIRVNKDTCNIKIKYKNRYL
ncbi:MAG: phage distal tail protein [Clostridium chrysemydis]|uniref:phage distal tail protein n=1 Tax=Clostridium chrysemydis TaxID=2665504 RepID=UPI003F2FA2C6